MKFVFDIDGTICFDYTDLSLEGSALLDLIEAQGHEVIFASARPIRDMIPVIKDKYKDHRLIGANGAMVSHQGEIVEACLFEKEQLKNIMSILEDDNAIFLADGTWDFHYNGDGSHELMDYVNKGKLGKNVPLTSLDGIMKIIVFEADDLDSVKTKLEALGLSTWQHPRTLTIDIVACHTNKYEALKRQGIDEYIAMGNDINDKEMLEHAKLAIMIDHHDDLVALVDHQVAYDENYLSNIKAIFKDYL